MKLPIYAGFILPNKERLESAGIGHCKVARQYINSHGLYEKFEKSQLFEEDLFMIEVLGAVKIAAYNGNKYIYIPCIHNWYIEEISELYKMAGYNAFYINSSFIQEEPASKFVLEENFTNYNTTVIKAINSKGEVIYKYNPNRIGD